MSLLLSRRLATTAISLFAFALYNGALISTTSLPASAQGWPEYSRNPHHTVLSQTPAQPLQRILWQTPVDLDPQYSGTDLFIHYGTPLITNNNTVIVTVKTMATDGFQVEGHNAYCGKTMWTQVTDYKLPAHDWTPSCAGAISNNNTLYIPAGGGTLLKCTGIDSSTVTSQRIAYYGTGSYTANPSAYDSVRINTPLVTDGSGNVYFGVFVNGSNSGGLVSSIVRVNSKGLGTWVPAAIAAGDSNITKVAHNCAPALSNDGKTLYITVTNTNGGDWGYGYLLALDTTTLATKSKVLLKDPVSGQTANVIDDSTATPTVGPNGDVYYGVLENPFANSRGWLLHFDSTLKKTKIPGAFGWDDTASIVPPSAVPSYTGKSPYLVLTKYNKYWESGLGGKNEVAVLDPYATEKDPITGATVMNEVLTVMGVTPDPGRPGGVREWCINSAAVDPITRCAIINSEDGSCYRWDFTTNSLSETVGLTTATGEAYTPTLIGPDGTCYAINNATLFAIGPNVANVSGMIGMRRNSLVQDPVTGHYLLNVTLQNRSECEITGSISLALDKLSSNAVLINATGVTSATSPAGSPYIDLTSGDLEPGKQLTVTLEFSNSTGGSITFTPRTLAGVGPR